MNKQDIKNAVKLAIRQSPYREDPNFSTLRGASLRSPVLVNTPAGEPAFWMVLFTVQDMACGFGHVDLNGQVTRIGIFGGSAGDRSAWIPVSYFMNPPPEILAEIESHYSGATLSEPIFSYDRSPARWAWMLKITREDAAPMAAFISPGGWYERRLDEPRLDYEG